MTIAYSSTGARSAKVTGATGTENGPSNPAKASGTLTLSTCVAGNTASVGPVTFTAHATENTGLYFAVGADDTATAVNLVAAINRYTAQHKCTAANAGAVVTVTAADYGTAGNAITLAETGDGITKGGATLSGGVDIVGLNLADLGGFTVHIEAESGQTVGGGKLFAYLLNPLSMLWARAPGLDLALDSAAARCQAFVGSGAVCGRGWIAYLPNSVTVSAGTVTVWMNGAEADAGDIRGGVL